MPSFSYGAVGGSSSFTKTSKRDKSYYKNTFFFHCAGDTSRKGRDKDGEDECEQMQLQALAKASLQLGMAAMCAECHESHGGVMEEMAGGHWKEF